MVRIAGRSLARPGIIGYPWRGSSTSTRLAQMGKRKSRQGTRSPDAPKQTNGWDALIRMIDALYDLTQTGNLFGVILLDVMGWVLLATYKVPDNDIAGLLVRGGRFLADERFYLVPLLLALAFSVATNVIQSRVYRSHIKELKEHRKRLVHGREIGKLEPLDNRFDRGLMQFVAKSMERETRNIAALPAKHFMCSA